MVRSSLSWARTGAGKSTTLKAISGLLRAQQARSRAAALSGNGERIDGRSPDEIVQMGIVQLLEGRRLFEHLTVEENLRTGAIFREDQRRSFAEGSGRSLRLFPRLAEFRDRTAGLIYPAENSRWW